MIRAFILAATMALTGCATSQQSREAYAGVAADGLATVAALSGGAVEVGAMGLWGFPIRIAALMYASTLPEHEATAIVQGVDAGSWSAATVSAATALGAAPPLAIAVGVAMWAYRWVQGEDARLYADYCAEWVETPGNSCKPFGVQ